MQVHAPGKAPPASLQRAAKPTPACLVPCVNKCSLNRHQNRLSLASVRTSAVKDDEYVPESPFKMDPGFFRMESLHDREPNYDDPDWFETVSDWSEFWNNTRFDLEAEQLSDDVDVSGAPTRNVDRAYQMIQSLSDVKGHPRVVNIQPMEDRRQHVDNYDEPPMMPETQEENPDWDENEWRAFAEKQHLKTLLDMEWRRRQAKIGQLKYESMEFYTRDVRLRRFDYLGETLDWEPEEFRNLITMNGTACPPENHKAFVENPMAVVDMVNTMGVHHIEDTEDFLERIGHLGDPEVMWALEDEVIIDMLQPGMDPNISTEMLAATLDQIDNIEDHVAKKDESNTWMGDLDHDA